MQHIILVAGQPVSADRRTGNLITNDCSECSASSLVDYNASSLLGMQRNIVGAVCTCWSWASAPSCLPSTASINPHISSPTELPLHLHTNASDMRPRKSCNRCYSKGVRCDHRNPCQRCADDDAECIYGTHRNDDHEETSDSNEDDIMWVLRV
jgi:hypothetical protein